jgi:hypothetical protein
VNRIDPNRLILVIAVVCLAVLAVVSGYRLEIGTSGLRLEKGSYASAENQKAVMN